jgi:uncharacterized protein (DUF362 family)/NAD-dependent dihydropyrimidine dehydrogenase PreA subunit
MERVVVKHNCRYDEDLIQANLEEIFKVYGGIDRFVKPGDRVVIKINLLMGKSPEEAVTTHPVLVKELVKLIKQAGGEVIIADSPAGPFNDFNLKRAYKISGLIKVAEETGATLNYNTDFEKMDFAGEVSRSFTLAKFITDADVIFNLPKLKTHGLTMYTGAVKNLLGTIPGLLKAEYHLKMQQSLLFSRMLVDLALLINPSFNIMDGVVGMEGEGPSGGSPKKFGYLMASKSPFALDVMGVYLMGIEPLLKVPTIKVAADRGFVANISEINQLGDSITPQSDTLIPDIEKESNLIDQKLPESISNIISYFLRPRPTFDHQDCVGCGDCAEICPADTIDMVGQKPEVDLDDCIRCFCCQELCKYKAVDIKRPLLGKLLFN